MKPTNEDMGKTDRAKRVANSNATRPETGKMLPDDESGGIPTISENPSGVKPAGSLVLVREDDLARLVYAARAVAFGAPLAVDVSEIANLDKASEAFADSFPWLDGPEPARPGDSVTLDEDRSCALVMEEGEVLVSAKASGSGRLVSVILRRPAIRALALIERRIP